jgi:exodeoxyribonuclease VII large subunit
MQTFSVQEITTHIHNLFDADPTLNSVWVQGEVSNLTKAASGHWYFTIKDTKSQLKCVMFRNAAQYVQVDVKSGDEILVHGRVNVYDARGEYQLYADQIEPIGGVGDLYRQFEELKAKLDAEGLFDADRKQPIATFPKTIGIVTSPTAAAYHDMQNVLRRRFPMVEIILSPTLVQGNQAPPQIVNAIQRLNEFTEVDTIIVSRGGGSIEDLWCFNDESVARAIADSRIPVISGVGHEIDFTIADFVSDLRAPTPSSAAELATPNRDDLLIDLDRQTADLKAIFTGSLSATQNNLSQTQQRLKYASPKTTITQARQQLTNQQTQLGRVMRQQMKSLHDHLSARTDTLNAANPAAILARGYAIVTDAQGNIIKSANQVSTDDRLTVQLHEDQLNVKVEN